MKIEKMTLKNFAKFLDFEIVFKDEITHLIGMNGDGKTTVGLTAMWAGFKGIAERSSTGQLIGERFRFISDGKKSLDVEMTLVDEQHGGKIHLKRHITKTTNTIKFSRDPESDIPLDKDYIEDLFNVSFLSATHFTSLDGQQQAAAMGIDVSTYDKKMKVEKDAAQEYRRDIKKLGDLDPVEKVEKKDIDELYEKQKKATEHNEAISELTAELSTAQDNVYELTRQMEEKEEAFFKVQDEYKAAMEKLEVDRIDASRLVKDFPIIAKTIDLEPIEGEIKTIVKSNEDFYKYQTYVENVEEKERLESQLSASKTNQTDIAESRLEYLQTKSFGIKGLQVDDKGQLTKNGKLIRSPYFSKGELEVLVARIGMNLNPELKVRFIDDFDLIDSVNQEKIVKHLIKKGFQIITASVGDRKKDDNCVLLRECKVVGEDKFIVKDVFKAIEVVKDPGETIPNHATIAEPMGEYDEVVSEPVDKSVSTGNLILDDNDYEEELEVGGISKVEDHLFKSPGVKISKTDKPCDVDGNGNITHDEDDYF